LSTGVTTILRASPGASHTYAVLAPALTSVKVGTLPIVSKFLVPQYMDADGNSQAASTEVLFQILT
jgi:hypothetical protein